MALDEPKENDDVHDINGFQLLWIKNFLTRPNRLKSTFWDMDSVSAPVSNLAHQPVEAAAQPAITVVD
jgi:hypothetical protein